MEGSEKLFDIRNLEKRGHIPLEEGVTGGYQPTTSEAGEPPSGGGGGKEPPPKEDD